MLLTIVLNNNVRNINCTDIVPRMSESQLNDRIAVRD